MQQESNVFYGQQKKEMPQQRLSEQAADGGITGGGKNLFSFSFEGNAHYEEFMRRPRSQEYLEAVQLIDMLSSTDEEIIERLKGMVDEEVLEEFRDMTPEEIRDELLRSLEEEFAAAELEFKDIPVPPRPDMVISKCYIDGCDVHAIDGSGNILRHYRRSERDADIERGRKAYYANEGCSCVEIYSDCCRVIMPDGSVKKVED